MPSIEELLGQLSGQEMSVDAPRFNRGTTDALEAVPHPRSQGYAAVRAQIPDDVWAAAQQKSGIMEPSNDGEMMYLTAAALQLMNGGDPATEVPLPDEEALEADPVGNGPKQMGGATDAIKAAVLNKVTGKK